MTSTVYRMRLVIDDEDYAVELHRSARAAGHQAALWARRFPDAQVIVEGIDVGSDQDDGEMS